MIERAPMNRWAIGLSTGSLLRYPFTPANFRRSSPQQNQAGIARLEFFGAPPVEEPGAGGNTAMMTGLGG